jgi:hypothetical protein
MTCPLCSCSDNLVCCVCNNNSCQHENGYTVWNLNLPKSNIFQIPVGYNYTAENMKAFWKSLHQYFGSKEVKSFNMIQLDRLQLVSGFSYGTTNSPTMTFDSLTTIWVALLLFQSKQRFPYTCHRIVKVQTFLRLLLTSTSLIALNIYIRIQQKKLMW